MEKSNCEKNKDYSHTKNKCEHVKNRNSRLKMGFLSLSFISSIQGSVTFLYFQSHFLCQ